MKTSQLLSAGLYLTTLVLPTVAPSAESVTSLRAKCSEETPEKCETQEACESAGGYFTEEKCVSLPTEDAEGTHLTVTGQTKDTDATFGCGIAVAQSEYVKKAALFLSQPVSIRCNVKVDSSHVGQTAHFVAFADYETLRDTPKTGQAESSWMVDNRQQNFSVLRWDTDPATLIPLQESVTLTERMTVQLYSGFFLVSSYLDVFFGYQLENGAIVYNSSPIDITIYPSLEN